MEETKISWTATVLPDGRMMPGATWNPWWGCTNVSAACDFCYAETLAKRFGYEWGPQGRRRFFDDKHWNEPLRWNRKAEQAGIRRKVFCASMADVFELLPESHPDYGEMAQSRLRLWSTIAETPWLTWLLLTKRPENILRMVPGNWDGSRWPQNVWVGTTTENQKFADRRLAYIVQVPAPVRFISAEPLLSHLWLEHSDLKDGVVRHWLDPERGVNWVVCGGESGRSPRPSHPDWFRSLRDQCQVAGVPFHFKQWGEYAPTLRGQDSDSCFSFVHGVEMEKVGVKAAGRMLDGKEWLEFPEDRA